MNWFTVLLIVLTIGALSVFLYLLYLLWNEISFTLKDIRKSAEPIHKLVEEVRSLQPQLQSLSMNVNQRMLEVSEVIEISKQTSAQVGVLVGAVEAYRSPNVQLALRYGQDWIEERRTHPILRKIKSFVKKIRRKLIN